MDMLYKYRDWSDCYNKRWINQREIFFSSPEYLNDPFECDITHRYDLVPEMEMFNQICSEIAKENSSLPVDEVKRTAIEWIDQIKNNPQKVLEFIQIKKGWHRDINNKRIGILSLSRTKESIVMWSHYAAKHKGFCIGYDYDKLRNAIIEEYTPPKNGFFEGDVFYGGYPKIIPFNEPDSFMEKSFNTKSKEWEYEQEYRIYICEDTNNAISLPCDVIKEITLGCNISEKDRKEIVSIVKSELPDVKLFQAKTHYEDFKLVFEPITIN